MASLINTSNIGKHNDNDDNDNSNGDGNGDTTIPRASQPAPPFAGQWAITPLSSILLDARDNTSVSSSRRASILNVERGSRLSDVSSMCEASMARKDGSPKYQAANERLASGPSSTVTSAHLRTSSASPASRNAYEGHNNLDQGEHSIGPRAASTGLLTEIVHYLFPPR